MAISRGRYDRSVSQEQRRRDQREQLLTAGADWLSRRRELPSVRELVAITRMGRNTFYEHFDDIDDLVDAVEHQALFQLTDKLQKSTEFAATPLAREREFAESWSSAVNENPSLTRALLARESPARELLRKRLSTLFGVLVDAAIRDGARSAPASTAQLYAWCFAQEGLTLYLLGQCPELAVAEWIDPFSDLLGRMLR